MSRVANQSEHMKFLLHGVFHTYAQVVEILQVVVHHMSNTKFIRTKRFLYHSFVLSLPCHSFFLLLSNCTTKEVKS